MHQDQSVKIHSRRNSRYERLIKIGGRFYVFLSRYVLVYFTLLQYACKLLQTHALQKLISTKLTDLRPTVGEMLIKSSSEFVLITLKYIQHRTSVLTRFCLIFFTVGVKLPVFEAYTDGANSKSTMNMKYCFVI